MGNTNKKIITSEIKLDKCTKNGYTLSCIIPYPPHVQCVLCGIELHPELQHYCSLIKITHGSTTLLEIDSTTLSYYNKNLLSCFHTIGIRHGILLLYDLVLTMTIELDLHYDFNNSFALTDASIITKDTENDKRAKRRSMHNMYSLYGLHNNILQATNCTFEINNIMSNKKQHAGRHSKRLSIKHSLLKRQDLDSFVKKMMQYSDTLCRLYYYKHVDKSWQNEAIHDVHYMVSSRDDKNTVAYLQVKDRFNDKPILNELLRQELQHLVQDKDWDLTFSKQPYCINKVRFVYHNGTCTTHAIYKD
jgi:hypothetical protein